MLKSFVGPFVATFFISMFVLLMQFLWMNIDEIIGKGLAFSIIAELLLYVSATLVSMALPLAVLLSSIMTFGNLGENYELIALKSAGISLYRIMYPLIVAVVFLSIIAFVFSNNILPVAYLKAQSLMFDIKRHKPEMSFNEGVFTNDLEGYSIKVDKINKKTGMMYKMLIYNHTKIPGNYEVTRADSGIMNSSHGNYLELTLFHGNTYTDEGMEPIKRKTFPFRRLKFNKQSVLIELPGNDLKRTDEELFKNGSAKMLNVNQLRYTIDSLNRSLEEKKITEARRMLATSYMKSRNRNLERDSILRMQTQDQVVSIDSLYSTYDAEEKQRSIDNALRYARELKQELQNESYFYESREDSMKNHLAIWHEKFTLSFACFIFFFIGAPLGGIIRKGGLGMPVIVSVFLFIVYYIISMIGKRSAVEDVMPIWFGLWLSSFVMLPLGIVLTYKSVTDSEVMNMDAYTGFYKKIKHFFKKKKDAA